MSEKCNLHDLNAYFRTFVLRGKVKHLHVQCASLQLDFINRLTFRWRLSVAGRQNWKAISPTQTEPEKLLFYTWGKLCSIKNSKQKQTFLRRWLWIQTVRNKYPDGVHFWAGLWPEVTLLIYWAVMGEIPLFVFSLFTQRSEVRLCCRAAAWSREDSVIRLRTPQEGGRLLRGELQPDRLVSGIIFKITTLK